MAIIPRFAPSPTGILHLGHARAALFAWDRGDMVLLRLEDIDPGRCRPEYADAIPADLAWLGLYPDGPVRVQSRRLAEYRAVLDNLVARGLAYPCFCTRADVAASAAAPHGPDGAPLYPGACRMLDPALRAGRLARGDRHALRLDMAAACAQAGPLRMTDAGQRFPCRPEAFGDVVLARKDAPASYHLCATHDDAVQGVTLVTHGEDLRPAASLHRLLQALMGWPEPAYAHHPLLLDASGRLWTPAVEAGRGRDVARVAGGRRHAGGRAAVGGVAITSVAAAATSGRRFRADAGAPGGPGRRRRCG